MQEKLEAENVNVEVKHKGASLGFASLHNNVNIYVIFNENKIVGYRLSDGNFFSKDSVEIIVHVASKAKKVPKIKTRKSNVELFEEHIEIAQEMLFCESSSCMLEYMGNPKNCQQLDPIVRRFLTSGESPCGKICKYQEDFC